MTETGSSLGVFSQLLSTVRERGAVYCVLIDPDVANDHRLAATAEACDRGGADAVFIGGSLITSTDFDRHVREVKEATELPVIIFPGTALQLSQYGDAVLFLSLISGRNPERLIGDQVVGAPIVKELGLEPIPTGYMLFESGRMTSTQFMSNTRPLPTDKPDIAKAHALAAEYLGMKCIYLEAGSGAESPVPDSVVSAVREYVSIPLIVGGGVKTPEVARSKVEAGASFVVTGTVFDHGADVSLIKEFANAIHIGDSAAAS